MRERRRKSGRSIITGVLLFIVVHTAWKLKILELELNTPWRISRSTSDRKTNFIIEVSDGNSKGLGEVAVNKRYGENETKIVDQFRHFQERFARDGHLATNKCCRSLPPAVSTAARYQ